MSNPSTENFGTPKRKLSDEQCKEIADRYLKGEEQRDLAKVYGVAHTTIRTALTRLGVKRPRKPKK